MSLPSVALQVGFGWPAFRAQDPHAWAILTTVIAVFVATEAASDPISTNLTQGKIGAARPSSASAICSAPPWAPMTSAATTWGP